MEISQLIGIQPIRSLPDELVLDDRVYVPRRWIELDLSTHFLSLEA